MTQCEHGNQQQNSLPIFKQIRNRQYNQKKYVVVSIDIKNMVDAELHFRPKAIKHRFIIWEISKVRGMQQVAKYILVLAIIKTLY